MKERDGIQLFRQRLIVDGIATAETLAEIDSSIDTEVNEATTYADKAAYASPESTLNYVYEEEK